MTNYREILRLRSIGLNHSQIAKSMAVTRQTVARISQRAEELGLSYIKATALSDREITEQLYPAISSKPEFKMPDYAYIHREMVKPGVTLQLLWFEYSDKCRDAGELPYQLTQFKKYYREYLNIANATMHINRNPGEIMEVDWAGQTAEIINTDTGAAMKAYIFIAALPYSGYAYAEAFWDEKLDAWITAHVNAYKHFGGVTRILVPDNLKTGVIKNTREELVLNKTYQEMAEHYGTAIIPARIKAPKDKSTVEGTVGDVSTYILAAIRNQQYFSLRELNNEIKDKLNKFNHKEFQKKEGSRATGFSEERIYLLPLPNGAFEISTWKVATVQYNYHISVDKQFYSVPYEYIKHKVDVRITSRVIEVFFEGSRICSHLRLTGRPGQYSTTEAHMPPKHQQYLRWDGDKFREWAEKIGPQTKLVIDGILTRYKVEQQAYRACMGLLKLADKYSRQRLEDACEVVWNYTAEPGYKTVAAVLKAGQDKLLEDNDKTPVEPSPFGFTRGAEYYGKGR